MKFRLDLKTETTTKSFTFETERLSIGSAIGADIVLDDPAVTQRHAFIVIDDNGARLVVESGGAASVDGEEVRGETKLRDGSQIQIGRYTLRFHSAGGRSSPGSPQPLAGDALWQATTTESRAYDPETDDYASPDEPTDPADMIYDGPTLDLDDPDSTIQPDFKSEVETPEKHDPTAVEATLEAELEPLPPLEELAPLEELPLLEDLPTLETPAGKQDVVRVDVSDDGLRSWDEIAGEAKEDAEVRAPERQRTDFERIQAASRKAQARSTTTKPFIVFVGLAALAGTIILLLLEPPDEPKVVSKGCEQIEDVDPQLILFRHTETDCHGDAECMALAKRQYEVGIGRLEDESVAIDYLFDGWTRLTLARELAAKAGYEKTPEEFSELEEKRSAARERLDEAFKTLEIKFHNARKREMHDHMATVLADVKEQFSHPGSYEHRWATARELCMKEDGTFPTDI